MIPTFARRIGRSLRDNQKRLIEEVLPTLKFDPKNNYNYNDVTLEIGFGNGEFTIRNAKSNPDDLHIGCEPYLNGVATLLNKIEVEAVENLKIFPDDARILLEQLPDGYLKFIYVICPDPWPKKRYHKRRIIHKNFIEALRSKLKSDGHIVFVTDHLGYAEWILDEINKCYDQFKDHSLNNFHNFPDDWHFTKYQRRGLDQGSKLHYFKLPK